MGGSNKTSQGGKTELKEEETQRNWGEIQGKGGG